MAVVKEHGRQAITHYRVIERFRSHTLVRVMLDTGSTHQIRVHMSYRKMPLLGDKVYGGRFGLPKNASDEFKTVLEAFDRQALHAYKLGFVHPRSKENVEWEVGLPQDMKNLALALRQDFNEHA
jgi:23S rRNA pseudouridine1911/1915/1917 synthase